MPQVYFRAVKAPRLMAGATVVTAVIRDFTGSFTSLASSFADNFIIPSSPQPLGGGAERRWGSKLLVGEQAGRTSPKPRLRAGQALGWGPGSGLSPAAPHRARGQEGVGRAKDGIVTWRQGWGTSKSQDLETRRSQMGEVRNSGVSKGAAEMELRVPGVD